MSKAVKKVFKAVKTVVSSVFGGGDKPKVPEPAALKEKPTAPTPDDAEAKRAAERMQQRRYAGRGRAGTILSGTSELG